ncbi:YceD family protein [Neorhizobium sp. DT-125]|uniref:YceD family protein n=1 Tax=Neorhizobium sp. DT-125 TaxID=3396163 RepID=UPI003F1DAB63
MKNDNGGGGRPPFSYPVKVGHISANPVTVRLEANQRELEALAKLWQVLAVNSLKAELQVTRWKKDGVRLKGRVEADIVQACIVTLDPVSSKIDEHFEQVFVPEGSKLARIVTNEAAEMVLDPEGPDLPEAFSGDTIDAGAAVTEFAALAIDPYPRKPGVEFADHIESDADEKSARPNPFAVLKDWKKD